MTRFCDVCAGIVLYNPDSERFARVVCSIEGQVAELVLVDNGSTNADEIVAISSRHEYIHLISNRENEGIAKALNQICQYGRNKGFLWCLTLDQDTLCPENLVEALYKHIYNPHHGIICPSVHYEGLNIDTYQKNEKGEYVYACMTSASLTKIEAWEKVGGFREEYFIDFVDNEFCMKLKIGGYKVYRTYECAISHRLGDSREIRFLWKKSVGAIHSPVRCYYMMRNNILFIRQYSNELNVLKEFFKVAYIVYRQLLFSRNKIKDLKYIAKGLNDGFKGKTGKYET